MPNRKYPHSKSLPMRCQKIKTTRRWKRKHNFQFMCKILTIENCIYRHRKLLYSINICGLNSVMVDCKNNFDWWHAFIEWIFPEDEVWSYRKQGLSALLTLHMSWHTLWRWVVWNRKEEQRGGGGGGGGGGRKKVIT